MLRSLLILTLAAMQFLSWGGGVVYLCVGCDGTCGIDFGPHCCRCEAASGEGHVKCCQPAESGFCHAEHSCHHQHTPEYVAMAADVADGHLSVAGQCGCVHIPLSVPSEDTNCIRTVRQSAQDVDHAALELSFSHAGSLTDISDQLSWTECVQRPSFEFCSRRSGDDFLALLIRALESFGLPFAVTSRRPALVTRP